MAKEKKDTKERTHPDYNLVCFEDVSTGDRFLTRSTLKSKETVEINGEKYYRVIRDITSASHPAFTGEKRFVDTAGRIEKFESKFRRKVGRTAK